MNATTRFLLATAAALLAAGAQAACYTVLDAKGEIISQTSTPPVDMSHQLHQVVPLRYGDGASLIFGVADASCGPEAEPWDGQGFQAAGAAPKPAARRRARRDRG